METRNRYRAAAAAAFGIMVCLAMSRPAWAEVQASEGWSRATTPGASVAVAYLVLTNTGAETRKLLKITSTVSDKLTLHRSSVDEQGVTRMWPMASLSIEPGETLRLAPGGLHVMFNAIKGPLVAGQKVPLTLKFDGGEPEFTLLLEVRPLVPDAEGRAGQARN